MVQDGHGGGSFREVTLHPVVTVADESMRAAAEAAHQQANTWCFSDFHTSYLVPSSGGVRDAKSANVFSYSDIVLLSIH